MKMSTLFGSCALLAALAMPLGGCDGEWGKRGTTLETRTFALHHMEASEAADLIGPYIYTEREGAPGMVSEARDDSPAITVRETADNLDRIAAVLAEFDRPNDRTLVLKFQLISPNGEEPDPRIADVVAELQRFLRFDGYSLAGETLVPIARGSFQQIIRTEEIDYGIRGRYRPASKGLDIEMYRTAGGSIRVGGTLLGTGIVIQPGKILVLGTVIEDNTTAILIVRSFVTDESDANGSQG